MLDYSPELTPHTKRVSVWLSPMAKRKAETDTLVDPLLDIIKGIERGAPFDTDLSAHWQGHRIRALGVSAHTHDMVLSYAGDKEHIIVQVLAILDHDPDRWPRGVLTTIAVRFLALAATAVRAGAGSL
ncbi:MAG: hypothetical protein AAGH70_11025 [Pseudomonadota bacterium]